MSPEAQRIAIAKSCGWSSCNIIQGDPMGRPVNTTDRFIVVPDYLTDLNAMHEAEKALGLAYDRWTRELRAICERDRRCIESAKASQRAEAFLRTIGKWEEEGKL